MYITLFNLALIEILFVKKINGVKRDRKNLDEVKNWGKDVRPPYEMETELIFPVCFGVTQGRPFFFKFFTFYVIKSYSQNLKFYI